MQFVYHKTTHSDVYERALSGKRDEENALIFRNSEGFVTESSIANVVAIEPIDYVAGGLRVGYSKKSLMLQTETLNVFGQANILR